MLVQDADITQELARLYFQRKLLKKANETYKVKGSCVALEPADFITISGDNYGGTHDVIIDSITIRKDLSIELSCTSFKATLENYA